MIVTAKQLRLAMTHLNLKINDFEQVGVGRATLQRLTASDDAIAKAAHGTVTKVRAWFESQGVSFCDDGHNVKYKPPENPTDR